MQLTWLLPQHVGRLSVQSPDWRRRVDALGRWAQSIVEGEHVDNKSGAPTTILRGGALGAASEEVRRTENFFAPLW